MAIFWPYTLVYTNPVIAAAVADDVCRHCGNSRCGASPTLCIECGRCLGLGNCHDSPNCGMRSPEYDGEEDTGRVANPQVLSASPAQERAQVAINTTYTVTFEKAMDPATLTPTTIYFADVEGNRLETAWASSGLIEYGLQFAITFSALAHATAYYGHITTNVKDVDGLSPINEYVDVVFTTVAA